MLELQVAAIAASATARATAARNVRRHTSSKKNGAIRLEAQANDALPAIARDCAAHLGSNVRPVNLSEL